MKIWLINHYAVPPQYYPLARPSLFAKNLIKMGHDVTIIAASTVHNSDKNLITGKEKVKKFTDDGIPYVLIKCPAYFGNGVKRVVNILAFAIKLSGILDTLKKPDVVVATSFDPLSCYAGIKYAKKHGISTVAEIADLWPETLVAYNGVSRYNPIVLCLRCLEKNIYTKADRIVFTMEAAYDYIAEQGWEKDIPKRKVAFINNGIDLKQFDYNMRTYKVEDADLTDDTIFKIVYAGSIRKVNNLDILLDVAKQIKDPKIKFLVWGDGDQLERLRKRVIDEKIENVVFKGRVDKKYVPFITSHADINFAHNESSPLFKYGISFNKIFDYLAAGKPIVCDFISKANPVIDHEAGITVDSSNIDDIAKVIAELSVDRERLDRFAINARKAAKQYDFNVLTQKLISVITSINGGIK